ncbi:uncharacterized protein [Solanum lycopersicum]|uniref:uncharacterized protein n=1 Tax=Solanum lycopersicum TaxID=4081 RepID=UPI003748C975
MVAPLNLEEGQSSSQPPRFNDQFYSWWKTRMHDYLMVEDKKLWDIVLDGPFIPTIEVKEAKEIWDCLRTAHEGTKVKESKVDMLSTQYENFTMKEGETIHDMHMKLSSMKNELRSLGEPIGQKSASNSS